MVDITATGWQASALTVLQSFAGAGARTGRENLVQIKFYPDDHTGARVYPSNGIPAPGPSLVGLREIDYIIPLSPLFSLRGPVTTYGVSDRKCFMWGVYHPSKSASGVTSLSGGYTFRVVGGVPLASGTGDPTWAGANPSFGLRAMLRELTTNIAASQLAPTTAAAGLIGYAIFGEL